MRALVWWREFQVLHCRSVPLYAPLYVSPLSSPLRWPPTGGFEIVITVIGLRYRPRPIAAPCTKLYIIRWGACAGLVARVSSSALSVPLYAPLYFSPLSSPLRGPFQPMPPISPQMGHLGIQFFFLNRGPKGLLIETLGSGNFPTPNFLGNLIYFLTIDHTKRPRTAKCIGFQS